MGFIEGSYLFNDLKCSCMVLLLQKPFKTDQLPIHLNERICRKAPAIRIFSPGRQRQQEQSRHNHNLCNSVHHFTPTILRTCQVYYRLIFLVFPVCISH